MLNKTALIAVISFLAVTAVESAHGEQWYKECFHAHSLWSDGDAAPEIPVSWYPNPFREGDVEMAWVQPVVAK